MLQRLCLNAIQVALIELNKLRVLLIKIDSHNYIISKTAKCKIVNLQNKMRLNQMGECSS